MHSGQYGDRGLPPLVRAPSRRAPPPTSYDFGNVVLQVILLIYSFYDGVLKHPEESGVLLTGLS